MVYKQGALLLTGSLLVGLLVLGGCSQTPISTQPPAPNGGGSTTSEPAVSGPAPNAAATLYGAEAAAQDQQLTLNKMLNYAIADEYLAQSQYQQIIKQFGEVQPFVNIAAAEATHIALLQRLFVSHAISPPEDAANAHLKAAKSIEEALALGVAAEEANIAMYERFLQQPGLPEDAKAVFGQLQAASRSHLQAFQRGGQTGAGNGAGPGPGGGPGPILK